MLRRPSPFQVNFLTLSRSEDRIVRVKVLVHVGERQQFGKFLQLIALAHDNTFIFLLASKKSAANLDKMPVFMFKLLKRLLKH
jgi:hypothetical protein